MLTQPFAISDNFVPATEPRKESAQDTLNAWYFCCNGSKLLTVSAAISAAVANSETACLVPKAKTLQVLGIEPIRTQFLGYLNNHSCVAVELAKDAVVPEGMTLQSLRSLHTLLRADLFAIAARAIQIIEWNRTHQYCGHCATPMTQQPSERAKRCPKCNLRQYPRLSPAVIMLIYKGEQLLLARAPRFREGMYSVLAGFVEPGESLEETVAREVQEEVGIQVKNIRYFGSQPWPFPNSLMVGFTAEYASGDIQPDLAEIEAADWFNKDDLPPIPGELSIAYKLIDWFVSENSLSR